YRTYDYVVGLRAVMSSDGMTADFYPFDMKFIAHVATRIVNEVKGVNRVVYDVTSKPPGTIEGEGGWPRRPPSTALRHDEEGACLARQARRHLRIPRLQECGDRAQHARRLGAPSGLGGAHQSRRPHVPRVAGEGPGRTHREEGDRADGRAAVDDQAAGARRRRQAARGLQAGAVREGICRAALTSFSCAFRASPSVRRRWTSVPAVGVLGETGTL